MEVSKRIDQRKEVSKEVVRGLRDSKHKHWFHFGLGAQDKEGLVGEFLISSLIKQNENSFSLWLSTEVYGSTENGARNHF